MFLIEDKGCLVHTRVWRRNASALLQDVLLISAVLRVKSVLSNANYGLVAQGVLELN